MKIESIFIIRNAYALFWFYLHLLKIAADILNYSAIRRCWLPQETLFSALF